MNRSTTKPISINRAVTTCAVTNLESKYTPPNRIPISKVSRMMRDHLISLLEVVLKDNSVLPIYVSKEKVLFNSDNYLNDVKEEIGLKLKCCPAENSN